jgi:hypothetical protein
VCVDQIDMSLGERKMLVNKSSTEEEEEEQRMKYTVLEFVLGMSADMFLLFTVERKNVGCMTSCGESRTI